MNLQGDIRTLLAAGPATLDELVDTLGPAIPPGRATRHAETTRRNSSGTPRRKVHRTAEQLVASGRRALIRDAANALISRGIAESVARGHYQLTDLGLENTPERLRADRDAARSELGDLREAFRRLVAAHDVLADWNGSPHAADLLAGPDADTDSSIVAAARRALDT